MVGRFAEAGGERLRLCKGRTCFRRTMAARMDQGIGVRRLQFEAALPRRGSVSHLIVFSHRSEKTARFFNLGKFRRR